mgnify:FL=1
MKEKNLPVDIESKSLDELKEILNNLVEKIENNKASNQSEEKYLEIFKLNRLIEKKFQNTSKEISEKNRLKIKQIIKKDGKKTK